MKEMASKFRTEKREELLTEKQQGEGGSERENLLVAQKTK